MAKPTDEPDREMEQATQPRPESKEAAELLALFHLIDKMMPLPPDLQRRHLEWVRSELTVMLAEADQRSGQPTERPGLEQAKRVVSLRNKQEELFEVLEARFGTVPESVLAAVAVVDDLARLDTLDRLAIDADSMEAFERQLACATGGLGATGFRKSDSRAT